MLVAGHMHDLADGTPTAGYPYRRYDFPTFNPVQSAVLRLQDHPGNIVVAAETSSGKTVAAELLMDVTLAAGAKVIYLSPLKALTEEKCAEWGRNFPDHRLIVMTGDYQLPPDAVGELDAADIVLMTSEMLDCRTRKFDTEANLWMNAVGLVVVDEAHILTMPRGDAVEVGLMRFTRCCPEARIAFLSATASNTHELARWLTRLNGRPTELVESRWRPVPLERHCVEYPRTPAGEGSYQRTERLKQAVALELVLAKPDEKFLVFVHSKRTGGELLDQLRSNGVTAGFHNGDLDLESRRELEASFKDRENGIRVLVSTSTTAWGVNLPARNVVILGVHCGFNAVDELDVIQMAGRAGRFGKDDKGDVYLVVEKGTAPKWDKAFLQPRPVRSTLREHHRLAFHALGEIYSKQVRSRLDLVRWHERSLAHLQAMPLVSQRDVPAVVRHLETLNMVYPGEDFLRLTALGRVSALLYLEPVDVEMWRRNFSRVFRLGLGGDPVALAWALASVRSSQAIGGGRETEDIQKEWANRLRALGLIPLTGAHLQVEAVHRCLVGDRGNFRIGALMRAFRSDAGRILRGLRMIDEQHCRWNRHDVWDDLDARLPARKRRWVAKRRGDRLEDDPALSVEELGDGVVLAGGGLVGAKASGLLGAILRTPGAAGVRQLTLRRGSPQDPLCHASAETGTVTVNLESTWKRATGSVGDSTPDAEITLKAWHHLLVAATLGLANLATARDTPHAAESGPCLTGASLRSLHLEAMRRLAGQVDIEPPGVDAMPFFQLKLAERRPARPGIGECGGSIPTYRALVLGADVGRAPAPGSCRPEL
jgi:late competence protein required for DNA uptake (superfamily II DNA/RNA helicase)